MKNKEIDNVDAVMFSLKNDNEIEDFFEDVNESVDKEKLIEGEEERNEVKENEGHIEDYKTNDQLNSTVRPLSQRLFGKIEAGSVRGSIFNMIILSLGTGCLSLPKAMGDMSLIMGLFSVILTCLATYWTLYILTISSEKYKIFSYSKLTRLLFGNVAGFVIDFMVLFYIFGILILYQVVIYKILGEVVYNLGGYYYEYKEIESFLTISFWNETYMKFLVMYGITIFIIIPLCLLKDVSKLRIASLLGIITLVFLILMIVLQCPFYIQYYWNNVYNEYDDSTHLNIFNIASGFDSNLFFFQGTTALFYSYTSHLGAFPIFNSLKNNIMRRIHKVIIRTLFIDTVFFVIICIAGYLTWPINTPSLIIERDNIAGGMDVIMSIGRIALLIIVIMKLPSSYNAFRISFLEMAFGDSKVTNKRNLLITIPTLCITVIIGILYDEVLGYIKLLGGFCSTTLGYIIPVNEYPIIHWKNITAILLILIMGTIGYISGIITLIGIINGSGH